MHWTDRRERYRALIGGTECLHPGSVFDAMSARIAEDIGFEIGMFAGSTASLTVLGAPDLIVLTLTEFAAQAYRINRAGKLPLMVDADHGYGNALNVMRTIQELETAGVAGIMIEDTILPRTFRETKPGLISIEEGIGKMKAALAAREDKSLVVIGRTSAAALTSPEDALARAKAYEKAGVDAMFFAGGVTPAFLEAVHAEVRIPLMLGGGGAPDRAFLARHGVRVALQGHQPIMAAVQAVHNTLKALRDGVKPSDLPGVASAELMGRVTRDANYKAWTKDFLG